MMALFLVSCSVEHETPVSPLNGKWNLRVMEFYIGYNHYNNEYSMGF